MKTAKPAMRACDVVDLLRVKYPLPAYAFLEQVADGTGARQTRWADAVAMSVWPSRGYRLYGFEVKVSRSDWLNELRNPAKADALMQHCDGWYLVVSDAAIVQADELPPTWGLMVAKGGRLTTPVAAPQLKPADFSASLVASILRNAVVTDAAKIANARDAGQRAGEESGRSHAAKELAQLRKAVTDFEAASGIHINEYMGGKELGEAVKVVQSMRWVNLDASIRAAESIVSNLKSLDAVEHIQRLKEEFAAAQKVGAVAE